MNERKTEQIIRQHFLSDKDLSTVIFEEQQSDSPKIKKLLKNASKNGSKNGNPEFIITYKQKDILIVVECKADIKYHDTCKKEVQHYASFLSKEYDVIGVAISGNEDNYYINHFLQLKNDNQSYDFLGDKLLSLNNYENSLLKSDIKFNQDYRELLDYSKSLNEKLHSKKYEIPENLRALLVSGILIGLQSDNFSIQTKSKAKKKPKDLAEDLVKEITRTLQEASIDTGKIQNLQQSYNFITSHKQLCEDDGNLYDLIEEINIKVNNFIKNYQYFDVLGKFYIEFLRYANGDKALGIVLTPPHITEFFADVTNVNKNSIIIDNCTGTGGFLISAMKRMIMDAKEDEEKIKTIKNKQLIGVENKSHVFSLAVSNMFIHGDGKSNIFHTSCFEEGLAELIRKKYNPTVGMLNPPYRTKKAGIQELKFVLNNLNMLSPGGKCVAIIPMSCVLAQKGEELELKKELLKHHTLDAVFTMPEQLFYPVGVITSVILLTAHKPHHNSYTYLGFYKDDGFALRRHKGRLDYYNKWKDIRKNWLDGFNSRQAKKDFSVIKQLGPNDEWCAEAYMETDYSRLEQKQFERILREYAGYKIMHSISSEHKIVNNSAINNEQLNLNTEHWKFFSIDHLFKIKKSNELSSDVEDEGTPLVSTSYFNNGVVGYLKDGAKIFDGNCITVACNGAAMGTTFYQDSKFYATADINILLPKFVLNPYIGLFLSTIIRQEKYRFNYGRKWGKARMENTKIKLPVCKDGSPDWQFMEDYIKSLPYSSSL